MFEDSILQDIATECELDINLSNDREALVTALSRVKKREPIWFACFTKRFLGKMKFTEIAEIYDDTDKRIREMYNHSKRYIKTYTMDILAHNSNLEDEKWYDYISKKILFDLKYNHIGDVDVISILKIFKEEYPELSELYFEHTIYGTRQNELSIILGVDINFVHKTIREARQILLSSIGNYRR